MSKHRQYQDRPPQAPQKGMTTPNLPVAVPLVQDQPAPAGPVAELVEHAPAPGYVPSVPGAQDALGHLDLPVTWQRQGYDLLGSDGTRFRPDGRASALMKQIMLGIDMVLTPDGRRTELERFEGSVVLKTVQGAWIMVGPGSIKRLQVGRQLQ